MGLKNQVPASLYRPSSIRLPLNPPAFTYPKGLLLRKVNNSGDISWHKTRIFVSEVFRFEELALELTTPLFEWSKVLYSAYDIKEIEARHAAALERGEWMYRAQDMEDSDDPLLHEFGKLRLDLTMGFEHDLNVPLQTLLQHYGLLSPVLDLTTDLDVALFFASHKFETDQTTEQPKITFVGTNARKTVVYVLRENLNEMNEHQHRRALERFRPERPNRQSCVVALCGTDALNLPAEFLYGIICLDFDDFPPSNDSHGTSGGSKHQSYYYRGH